MGFGLSPTKTTDKSFFPAATAILICNALGWNPVEKKVHRQWFVFTARPVEEKLGQRSGGGHKPFDEDFLLCRKPAARSGPKNQIEGIGFVGEN